MKYWTNNLVTIEATIDQVDEFIAVDWAGNGHFNMHKLFPEKFDAHDACGRLGWNYRWALQNTGAKWFPDLCLTDYDAETLLAYNTACSPNNLTLLRLSKLTSWKIENIFEEPEMWFEGEFVCQAGEVMKNIYAEYRPSCGVCLVKKSARDMIRHYAGEDFVCRTCAIAIVERRITDQVH